MTSSPILPAAAVSSDASMLAAAPISVADAGRQAFRELKLWIEEEWGLSSDQAAIVMGIGGHCGIGQMSNLLHTAKGSIPLSLLPEKEGAEVDNPVSAM